MQVNLSPELQHFVRDKISSGAFHNEQAVIEAAIALMRQAEEKRVAFLRQAIAGSEADLAAGLGEDYTADLLQHMQQEAELRVERRAPIHPDAIG